VCHSQSIPSCLKILADISRWSKTVFVSVPFVGQDSGDVLKFYS
jgi:hypothetical protein